MKTAELKTQLSDELEVIDKSLKVIRERRTTDAATCKELVAERKKVQRVLNAIDRKPRSDKASSNGS